MVSSVMKNKRKNIKRNEILSLAVTVAIIVLINIIGSFVYTRFDLTSEKRYTLSDTSKEILKDLNDYVYFRVYLEGEFPAGFKKLRKETKEMLDEFRAYSKFIDYDFINPSESNDPVERSDTYKMLYQNGLNYYTETVQTNSGMQQIMVWPGVIITYQEKELPIDLLSAQSGQNKETILNNSSQDLEYKLISGIKEITSVNKPSVAFLEGHGELSDDEVYDIGRSISSRYSVKSAVVSLPSTASMEDVSVDTFASTSPFV